MLMSDQLRECIEVSGLSLCQIARDIDVNISTLSRFMNEERGLQIRVIDDLGEYLGLEIHFGEE